MMNKDKQFLQDLLAYVRFVHNDSTLDAGQKYYNLISTIGHDLNGTINEEPFFRPRVSGYSSIDNQ